GWRNFAKPCPELDGGNVLVEDSFKIGDGAVAESSFDLAAQGSNVAAKRVVFAAEEISVCGNQGRGAVQGLIAERTCIVLDESKAFGNPGLPSRMHGVRSNLLVNTPFGIGGDAFDGLA